MWVYIWRTPLGYELRVSGKSEKVSLYAGIHFKKITIITLMISGALAGMMAVNEIMGVHNKLVLGFTAGYGFTGIAVALMGRNHQSNNCYFFKMKFQHKEKLFRFFPETLSSYPQGVLQI